MGATDAPSTFITQKIAGVLGALYKQQETDTKHVFFIKTQKGSKFTGNKKVPIKAVSN